MEKLNEKEQNHLLTILLMDLVDDELLTLEEAMLARKIYLQGDDIQKAGKTQ